MAHRGPDAKDNDTLTPDPGVSPPHGDPLADLIGRGAAGDQLPDRQDEDTHGDTAPRGSRRGKEPPTGSNEGP
jgi:hypothetical protein